MKKILLLLVVLLATIAITPVSAQSVSFATIDGPVKDLYMYAGNGTLLNGAINSTSTGIALPNDTDVIFTLKPHSSNPLESPGDFLETGFAYLQTNVIPIIIMIFLIALFFRRR